MPRNQLSLLGLEIKCIAECDCKQREWEKEGNKKRLKTIEGQYFYKWMINIWLQLWRGRTGAPVDAR